MQHHVATKLAILTAHVLFGLSLLVLGYAAKNYFGLKAIVPGIEAVSPVTADATARVISLQLPESDGGDVARRLVQSQANELHTLHEHWLAHMQFHVIYARNQFIAWALLSTLALGLVVILHFARRAADSPRGST